MNRADYDAFTAALIANLRDDPRVLGLIAAGSMANTSHAPDAYSDHDFWIITEPGAQEHFRTVYDWLPECDRIALAFRETQHGVKLLYDFGHLVEYAVFAPEELAVTRLNSTRVLLDQGDISALAAQIVDRTAAEHAARRADPAFLFGQFITHLWVGVGRHYRGEQLSGHAFVKNFALGDLLPLIAAVVPAEHPDRLDNIDPARRFEQAYPALGAEINALLLLAVPEAAAGLLRLADRLLQGALPDYPAEAVQVVLALAEQHPPA
ncbi:MAG: hypothetical protein JXN59_12085 [Anaerolineae bacterium]|nr:hypothetical protein [Anaerolineae bacterium]